MRIGKLAGVQLILNNWFLVLLALFAAAGMFWKVAGMFLCVAWHEGAHAWAARALGFRVREMELLPFGGVARIEGLYSASMGSDILMAIAGPAASLGLAAGFYTAQIFLPAWQELWQFYFEVNLMLGLVNLIPAFPLDGGRILRAWLVNNWGYAKGACIAAGVGRFLAIILLAWAAGDFLLTGMLNLSLMVIALFVFAGSGAERGMAAFHAVRLQAQKKAALAAQRVIPTASLTAVADVMAMDLVKSFRADSYYVVLVLDPGCRFLGVLTESDIWDGLPDKGVAAKIGDLLR